MRRFCRHAIFSLMALWSVTGHAQNKGGIEFSDSAPPSTEQEKIAAKEAASRAVVLSTQIQTLSSALNASLFLMETVNKLPPTVSDAESPEQLVTALSRLHTTLNHQEREKHMYDSATAGRKIGRFTIISLQSMLQLASVLLQREALSSSTTDYQR